MIIFIKADHTPAMQSVIHNKNRYKFAYDYKTKQPAWIIEVLTPDIVSNSIEPSHVSYQLDSAVPSHMQAKSADYENSGFVMTNLLSFPNRMESEKLYITMVSPQLSAFNQGYWQKLNHYIQNKTRQLDRIKVITISGPLYLPNFQEHYLKYQIIGESGVAVPTHFFKIFLPTNDTSQAEIYVMPNREIDVSVPLENFRVSLEKLEAMSGIIFPDDFWEYFFMLPPKLM
jgi:endonuclease G